MLSCWWVIWFPSMASHHRWQQRQLWDLWNVLDVIPDPVDNVFIRVVGHRKFVTRQRMVYALLAQSLALDLVQPHRPPSMHAVMPVTV